MASTAAPNLEGVEENGPIKDILERLAEAANDDIPVLFGAGGWCLAALVGFFLGMDCLVAAHRCYEDIVINGLYTLNICDAIAKGELDEEAEAFLQKVQDARSSKLYTCW
jgi:hypothetical protein